MQCLLNYNSKLSNFYLNLFSELGLFRSEILIFRELLMESPTFGYKSKQNLLHTVFLFVLFFNLIYYLQDLW